ncbi:MAG: glycosyltransferase [Planctomycetota bacterium]
MSAPRISVIMTVRNDERYLARAVESVLSQDVTDFEFIIVDDGSTDGSPDVVRSITDSRVRLLRQEASGVAAGLNRALAEASGDLVARQDADDASLPGRFRAQIDFLSRHTEIDALGTGFRQIDDGDKVQGTFPGVTDLRYLEDLLLVDNPFMHGSMMIRAEVLRRHGGYRNVACEDFELWTRLAGRARFANLPEVYYDWRWHEKAVTKRNATGLARDAVAIRVEYLARRLAAPGPSEAAAPGERLHPLAARRLGYNYFELGRLFFELDRFDRAAFFLDLARRTHATPLACLWNRLSWSKHRISRAELRVKLRIARLDGRRRGAAKAELRKSNRFPYANPILVGRPTDEGSSGPASERDRVT